jgi:pimeloyl-ACP methyl ester carboxylesterase
MFGYLFAILFIIWLAITLVAMVVIIYLFLNLPAPEREDDGRKLVGEEVRFPASDGATLKGTFVPSPGRQRAPCVIFGHAFGADRHEAARATSFLPGAGFHVFAFDFRGHGESQGDDGYEPERWVTRRERDDLLAAVAYCAGRPEVAEGAVGLFGLSRGANAALCGASAHPAVRALVVESAFSTRELLKMHVKKRAPIYVELPWLWRYFPDPLFSLVTDLSLGAMRLLMGRRYLSVDRAVTSLNGRPCLFIHGDRDPYIDRSLTEKLYAKAGEPKALWIVPGARHNDGLLVAPETYKERVVNFLSQHLEGKPC